MRHSSAAEGISITLASAAFSLGIAIYMLTQDFSGDPLGLRIFNAGLIAANLLGAAFLIALVVRWMRRTDEPETTP